MDMNSMEPAGGRLSDYFAAAARRVVVPPNAKQFSLFFTTNFGRLVDWSNVVNGLRPIYKKCLKFHFEPAPFAWH